MGKESMMAESVQEKSPEEIKQAILTHPKFQELRKLAEEYADIKKKYTEQTDLSVREMDVQDKEKEFHNLFWIVKKEIDAPENLMMSSKDILKM